ncbi:hypothetical protein HYH03_003546 [Edaphochlamys debaryana]|uniref:Plastid lipid-associated protein/fibrillin conserved domain-containing protein n=1 Tax=Edaphochlamys debaryana TaxID=47281 RepID=A0A835Y8M6_9CHLO|nr:hypothetical protein HYH03_003546 [Edaphochlamys debaryana]|eukprot:KAG2498285.1 hypothetical protein HYH03_003546 [Edaphochlamys debaryana]
MAELVNSSRLAQLRSGRRARVAARAIPDPQPLSYQTAEIKKDLDLLLSGLGFPQAVLPSGGADQTKAQIDKLLHRLEALTPAPMPLAWAETPGGLPRVAPVLLGDWELVYASNGTVVTRTGLAQLLLSASQLPGVGISDITQSLSLNDKGNLVASNSAVFGFGPLGGWRVGIEGVWRDSGDGKTARVLFDQVSVKPVSALGLPVPSWLPAATLNSGGLGGGGSGENRSGADWVTTFVDRDLRVGRGKTGNTFLFRRKPPT